MKYSESLILWNDDGDIRVVPKGQDIKNMPYSGGGAFSAVASLDGSDLIARLMFEALFIIVEYGIDPKKAHEQFLNIEEYREVFDNA